MEAKWGVDGTMAAAVEGAVQPSPQMAATSKVRPGCVLAAAGLAVATGCLGVGGTVGLGLYGWPWSRVGLNWGGGSSEAGMIRGWMGSSLGGHR